MKNFKITFLILFLTSICFAQTEYKTTQGLIFKVGDTIQIGQPMGISLSVGHWKAIFTKKGGEITNNNLINKKVVVNKIENIDGITRFCFRIYSSDFYANIDEALAKGEIINPYNKPNNSKKELDKYDKLKKAKELFDSGVLTKEEFEIEKKKILDLEN